MNTKVSVLNRLNTLKMLIVIFFLPVICIAQPSTDRNNPTSFTSNTVESEYDGLPTSKLVDVELLEETGRSLLLFGVVAKEEPQTETRTRTFIGRQPVILKVFLREDNDIKHLTYKVQIDGPVEFEGVAMPPTESSPPQPMGTAVPADPGQMGTPVPSDPGQMSPNTPAPLVSAGDRMCFPESGMLVIQTTDGQSLELDLKQVVKVSVKP